MVWEELRTFLTENIDLMGVSTALIGVVIGIWWFLLGGLKQIWSWVGPQTKSENDIQTIEAILDKLMAVREVKVEVEKERDELGKAIISLQRQSGLQREEALEALKAGRTDKAEALFLAIAEERSKNVSTANKEAAEAWRHVGALAFLHNTQKALAAYAGATKLQPDNPEGWNRLGLLQMRVGKLDAAKKSYLKVLSLGNRAADKSVIAMATGNLGAIHQTRGDLDMAEEMHLNALWLNKGLGNVEGMASDYGNLGQIHLTRGDLDSAEEMFRKSLALEEEHGSKQGIANDFANLGVIHKMRGDLDSAEEMLLKALKLHMELGSKEGMANQYGNLGLIHQTRGDLDKAEEMLLKALKLHKELGSKEGMANQYGNLGLIHQTRGDLDKAEEMHLKSLALSQELGRKEGMASDFANLGVIHKMRGELKTACSDWRKSRDLFTDIGIIHMAKRVEKLMSDAECVEARKLPDK